MAFKKVSPSRFIIRLLGIMAMFSGSYGICSYLASLFNNPTFVGEATICIIAIFGVFLSTFVIIFNLIRKWAFETA